MAGLRDNFGVNTSTGQAPSIVDEATAAGMGEVGRGWESGRIGNDVNRLRSEEAGLRSDGNVAGGDALAARVAALKQRQGIYAPAIGKVEDIHGVGDGMDWLGGQVGQGVASSIDQIATGTAIGGAATLAGLAPNRGAQLLSKGLRLAAPAAMYAQNVPLLKGENYDAMTRDPDIMAGHSAQELNSKARNSGMTAALLDTALPAYMAHGLGGAGLRAGLHTLNPIAHAGAEMLGEGATETVQELIKQRALSDLNANRDKSGDNSDLLNSFAGGFAGSGPMSGISSATDAGFRRVGHTAGRLGTAVGQGVDLLNSAVGPHAAALGEAASSGLDQAKKLGSSWWKAGSKAATDLTDSARDENGDVSAGALMGRLQDVAQNAGAQLKNSDAEREILMGQPPAHVVEQGEDAALDWLNENDQKRANLVASKLIDMADTSPAASAALDELEPALAGGVDADTQSKAVDKAAKFVLAQAEAAQFNAKAERAASTAGELAGVAGGMIGRGAVAAGKAAARMGGSIMDGVRQGMSKKNMQTLNPQGPLDAISAGRDAVADANTFQSWRDRVYGVRGQDAADIAIDARGKELSAQQVDAQEMSYRRASLFGELMASASPAQDARGVPGVHSDAKTQYLQNMGYEIASMAESWAAHAEGKAVRDDVAKRQAPGAILALDSMANDMRVAYGVHAEGIISQMESAADPSSAPMFARLKETLAASGTAAGRKSMEERRTKAANDLLLMLPAERAAEVMRSGKNGRSELLESLEEFSRGNAPPRLRASLEEAVGGREKLNRMLEVVSGIAVPETKVGSIVDDRIQAQDGNQEHNPDDEAPGEQTSAYDQAAAEKTVVNGSGPKMYGFHATTNIRSATEGRDPFSATEAPNEDGIARRPKLFTKGQQLFGGKGDAIEKKISDMRAKLLEDPNYPDHDNHRVEAKSVRDVMKDMGMQPGKILQLFRDYSHADYTDEKASPEDRRNSARMAGLAGRLINDTIQSRDNKSAGQQYRTTPEERKEVRAAASEYFKNRFVVVGEQISNRDPEKMPASDLLALAKHGAGLLERARGSTADGVFKPNDPVDQARKLVDANLLMFQGKDGKPVAISAGKLVNWVRSQRGAEETDNHSNQSKDAAYLADVKTGVSTIMGSGFVATADKNSSEAEKRAAWPTMVNKFGKKESFADGVPGALRLATTTQGDKQYGRDMRLESAPERRQTTMGPANKFVSDESNDARLSEGSQESVAADQMRQSEFFTPEDREQRDLVVDDKAQSTEQHKESNQGIRFRHRNADGAAVGSVTVPRGDRSGQFVAEPKIKTDAATGLDRTDRAGYDGTELDFFPKKKDGQMPGDFDDQQWLTKQTNPRFEGGPEPKGTAVSSAKFRAGKITEAYIRDQAEGQEMIRSRIRAALRPAYTPGPEQGKFTMPGVAGKDQVVGGPHYIAPLAEFISTKNLTDNNIDMGAGAIAAIRSRVAGVLLNGGMAKADQVAIAKLMMDNPSRITAMNVAGELGKMMAPAAQPQQAALKVATVAPKAEPAAAATQAATVPKAEPAAPKPMLENLIGKHAEYLKNPNSPDFSPEKAKAISEWADKQVARMSTAIKATSDRDEQSRLENLREELRDLVVDGKSMSTLDALTTESRLKDDNYDGLDTVAHVDDFLKAAHSAWERGASDLSVQAKLDRMFKEGTDATSRFSGTDLASFYDGMKGGNADLTHEQLLAKFNKPEVAAGLGKLRGAENAQSGGNSRVATQEEMDSATDYAKKVLGPKIKVLFKDITGYSGEFVDHENAIHISTTAAAGTLGTLYHEAMHVFFRDFVKGNPKLQDVLGNFVNDPKLMAKLRVLLNNYPAAQAQLGSGEERLAYTYQFWKAGLLKVDATAHTFLQKVGKFFRRVMGQVRDSERALELFQAFDGGKMSEPSAAGRVIADALAKGTMSLKVRANLDALTQGLMALTLPAGVILGNNISPMARKIGKTMFTNPGEEAHGSLRTGMMNARRNITHQYINRVNRVMAKMSDVDMAQVQKHLQSETNPVAIADPAHREYVQDIREQLDQFHKYMIGAGMKIGHLDRYYPTVWSTAALQDKKEEFISLLATKYVKEMRTIPAGSTIDTTVAHPGHALPRTAAERIWAALVERDGVDAHLSATREDGVLDPFFASQEQRTLPWLQGADKEKFLEKNMQMTLSRYFTQGAHATEYFRRFGKGGTKLDDMMYGRKVPAVGGGMRREDDGVIHDLERASQEKLKRGEIKNEGSRVKWVSRQMRDVSMSVGAMEGSLGKDVSPTMRKFNSWMTTYQNIRLLPLSLFSSVVDPLAIVARGAPLQAAYESFVYGMKEVWNGWADAFKDMPPERQNDEWRDLAEHIGASDVAMFSHHVGEEYSSAYMTAGAKKLNDKMFVLNGMEAWNRGTRIMATKWATRFIEKHADLPDAHSARWLKELGLTPSMITRDEGKLVTNVDQLAALKGITQDQAARKMAPIYDALNRWVEGAVLTPNAAQRPAWSSDPNYASAFHLKQFSYSFHETILKRAINEFKHGNLAPVGALAMFIPTMITSDVMKGLLQGGGTLPPYMASMNVGDWFEHGINRAGLTGMGVVGVDAAHDWASLGGPAVEQIVDGVRDGFGAKTGMNSLPLHALYAQAMSHAATAAAVTN